MPGLGLQKIMNVSSGKNVIITLPWVTICEVGSSVSACMQVDRGAFNKLIYVRKRGRGHMSI